MNSKLLLYNFYRTDTTYDWSLPTHSQLKQTILTFEDKIVRLIGPHAALSDSGFLFHLLNILESLSILVDKVEKPKMRLSVASSLMCKRWKPRTERRAGSASPSLSIWIKGARAWGQTDRQPADPSSADTQGSFGGGGEPVEQVEPLAVNDQKETPPILSFLWQWTSPNRWVGLLLHDGLATGMCEDLIWESILTNWLTFLFWKYAQGFFQSQEKIP